MRRRKALLFVFLSLVIFIIQPVGERASACTLIVASGRATASGRPLLWKNRDASNVLNKLMYFNGKKYNFIGLINSTDASGQEIWGGLNEKGLAIINSQADDLALRQKKFDGADNGVLMKMALGECATVDEVEKLLQREKGRHDLSANFGVIDALGGAVFFETSSEYYTRFDTADKKVALLAIWSEQILLIVHLIIWKVEDSSEQRECHIWLRWLRLQASWMSVLYCSKQPET